MKLFDAMDQIGNHYATVPLLAIMIFLQGCTSLPPRPQTPPVRALRVGDSTQLDRAIAPVLARHSGQSGFHLLSNGVGAFALRGLSARAAGRSLDVQYYIWHNDLTGRLLALALLDAADRGVRVRVLLDDMDARAKNFMLAALAAHPNISVRLFNPFASRRGLITKGIEGLTSFSRINHRMHNKTWIADNRFAIAGGRNIGDEYFAASDNINFNDLDLAIVGPAVQQFSNSFDRYWNSDMVWPIQSLSPNGVNAEALAKLRKQADGYLSDATNAPYIRALETDDAVQSARTSLVPMQWTSNWQILSDLPDKTSQRKPPLESSTVLQGLTKAISAARHDVVLISPYFVPGKGGTKLLVEEAQSGRSVRILTNSMAANDVVAVHGGYTKYRKRLLKGGVELWELKPEPSESGKTNVSLFGSSGASLHTKAAVMDNSTAFVGSFNLDPRSISLNCEQGVLVSDPVIAEQVTQLFNEMSAPSSAWRVKRDADGALRWTDDTQTFHHDPQASFMRRVEAMLARWLPIEPML